MKSPVGSKIKAKAKPRTVNKVTTDKVKKGQVTLTEDQVKARLARVAELLDQVFISIDRKPDLLRPFYFTLADVNKFTEHAKTRESMVAISRV